MLIEKDFLEISRLGLVSTFTIEFTEKNFNEPYLSVSLHVHTETIWMKILNFVKKNVSNSVGFVLFYFEYFFELASNHHSKHDLFQKDKASGGSDASLRCAFFEKKTNFSLNLILSKATSD